jgi:hypothetical protein
MSIAINRALRPSLFNDSHSPSDVSFEGSQLEGIMATRFGSSFRVTLADGSRQTINVRDTLSHPQPSISMLFPTPSGEASLTTEQLVDLREALRRAEPEALSMTENKLVGDAIATFNQVLEG